MARGESPYQGRYTVPIHDYSALERGGAAWGEAFKGVGESMGGAIEKYGLKKEKQKEDKGTLKGLISTVETLKRTDTSDSAMVYDATLARLKDEDIPLGTRVAEGQETVKGINFSTTIQNRQMSTEQTRLANELAGKVQDLMVRNQELRNRFTKAQARGAEEAKLGAEQTRLQEAGKYPLALNILGQESYMNSLETKLAEQKIDLHEALKGPAKKQANLDLKETKARINKINKEAKKLKKETDAAGISEREFKPVLLNGVALPNTYYGKGNTPYYVDTTNPQKPIVSAITGTPAEQRAEVRLRLEQSLLTLGDMPAGQFEDFVGYDDPKRALSISQYVDVLDFGEELEDGEIHWTDKNTKKLHRFNKEKFPKPEELDEDTLRKVKSFLKARGESASLFESEESPVGGGEDLPEESLDDEIHDLMR